MKNPIPNQDEKKLADRSPSGFDGSAFWPHDQTRQMTKLWSVPECAHLAAEYDKVRQNYASVVDRFFATGYAVSEPVYRVLKNDLEEARSQSEIARARLERHKFAAHSQAS